jgi:CRP/FNR family transcriptional regulator
VGLFRGLPARDLHRVERGTLIRRARRGEVLYQPGEPGDCVYVLKSGIVRIASSTGGHELTLALLRKGEVFGEEALLGGAPRDHTAEAYEDCLLCSVPRGELFTVLRRRPEMVFEVARRVGQRLRILCARVEGLVFRGASARLAHTLVDLASQHGVRDADGVTLPLRLSQTELARLIGVTRESVNAAFRELRRRGLVTVDAGRLRLLDVPGLGAVR